MRCKYDPAHTTEYSNAVALSKHYAADHSDVYAPPEKVPCEVCGKPVSVNNTTDHMRRLHGAAALVPVKEKKPKPPDPVAWNPKQVVVPVVRELFGEHVPTDSLGEVIDFAEATRRLIERSQQ